VYAYAQLVQARETACGEPVDFTVPTGNFGNILAGYYAKCMGLPIRRLVCASNANNVLTDFFNTGEYNANRAFFTTISPSMDILVSSNLERLLYHASESADCVRDCMNGLSDTGKYTFAQPLDGFFAACADENETKQALRDVWKQGYLTDPHTAVAYHAAQKTADGTVPNVIVATASPYKFAADVYEALTGQKAQGFQAMDGLNRLSGVPVPLALGALSQKEIRHKALCGKADMLAALDNLGIFTKK
jgi:threonine synthase